jgi:nicotinate-nucleotide adenylyltransferase
VIGVLGGTFDPIHFGHLRPALEIHEHLRLDALHFVPCNVPPHRKAPATAAEHRLAMVAEGIAGVPGFRADRRELDRAGPSYTVDTLHALRAEFGPQCPLVLIMGTDAFAGLQTWNRWQEIPHLAHVLVAHRPGSAPTTVVPFEAVAEIAASADALRQRPYGRIFFQAVTQLAISATGIRACLRSGRSPRYLLPDAVGRYINEHGLYRTDTEESA